MVQDQFEQGVAVISGAVAAVIAAGAKEYHGDEQHALDEKEDHTADNDQNVEELVDALGFGRSLRWQNDRNKAQ